MICSRLGIVLTLLAPVVVSSAIVVGCSTNTSTNNQLGQNAPSGPNTIQVTVNGSLCGPGADQYANEPCGSVTICQPGTANCQTINNLLIDTGSSGLRIFQSVITVPLTPVGSGSGTLAECVQFGDGSSMWGTTQMADVRLGGEAAVTVPIQVVNSAYASPPASCTSSQSTPETDPASAGFNGILGVGLFDLDCGAGCQTDASNGIYFSCSGSSCSQATAPTQVRNPVALLPSDNNGVILQFPSVGSTGAASLNGTLILGISTQANNVAQGVSVFAADPSSGMFQTIFDPLSTTAIPGLIDSGSSMLFIPTVNALPDCSTAAGGNHGTDWAGLFCPSSDQSLSATNEGAAGGSGLVNFQISNDFALLNSSASVFSNVGASSGTTTADSTFDWGLPFFYGRSVYVGLENKSSPIGTGVYWAY